MPQCPGRAPSPWHRAEDRDESSRYPKDVSEPGVVCLAGEWWSHRCHKQSCTNKRTHAEKEEILFLSCSGVGPGGRALRKSRGAAAKVQEAENKSTCCQDFS